MNSLGEETVWALPAAQLEVMLAVVGFDASKKYPVIVMVYGGPHSQNVRNLWAASAWEQDLARSDKGTLLPTLGNVHMILSNHKAWQGGIEQALRDVGQG